MGSLHLKKLFVVPAVGLLLTCPKLARATDGRLAESSSVGVNLMVVVAHRLETVPGPWLGRQGPTPCVRSNDRGAKYQLHIPSIDGRRFRVLGPRETVDLGAQRCNELKLSPLQFRSDEAKTVLIAPAL